MKNLDLDKDNHLSFLEYVVSAEKEVDVKTLMERPQGTNQQLIDAQAALKKINEIIAKKEAKIKKLEAKAAKGGVKGKAAANEIEQMMSEDQTEINKLVVTAKAALKKAKKGKDTTSMGNIWWCEREIEEKKKYKPRRKKIDNSKFDKK